jgi:predicted nucleotidyltransferase
VIQKWKKRQIRRNEKDWERLKNSRKGAEVIVTKI